MARRALVFIALTAALTVFLAACGVSDMRYYVGAFEQNPELRELFQLFQKEKDQQNRFVLIDQIAAALANEGRTDREILFLTTYVEKNPADIYNGYYLLRVADAYRDMKSAPLAIHYYRRVLSNYGDLLVGASQASIHRQCLQELLALETNPEEKIAYYKELFSRFPDPASGLNWYYMAKAYEDVGEWDQSIQAYQKYISSIDVETFGESATAREAAEKVNFYTADKTWLAPDLPTLVAAIKDAIQTKNVAKLRRYQAQVNFFQEPWDQNQLQGSDVVNYNIVNYLSSSSVSFGVNEQPEVAASGTEATFRTSGWNFRPAIWYLYFRQVDFPADPDINGQWEWAGVYFGEKMY
jgi:tetratricopeptide (TPR) repeat protein